MPNIDTSLLELVRITFDAHSAVLFLPDLTTGDFILSLASTEAAPYPRETQITSGKGLVGWILRHKQAVIVNDMKQHSCLGYYGEKEETVISAFMGCHLPNGGALCIDSIRPHQYSNTDQSLLYRFASHIAQQVRSEILAENAIDLRHYFSYIEQIIALPEHYPHWNEYLAQLLNLLARSGEFEYVAFSSSAEGSSTYTIEGENTPLLIDDQGNLPELSLATGGLVGWVFRNESPIYGEGIDGSPVAPLYGKLPDIPEFQSAVCLPVVLNKMTCGVLCFAGTNPRAFSEHLRAFLRITVSQLTHRLESLSLRHRLKSLLPRARIHRDGATAYDPDIASQPPIKKEDN